MGYYICTCRLIICIYRNGRNMAKLKIDKDWFAQFEKSINTSKPEYSEFPANVLGFGEISAVIEFRDVPQFKGWIFKRLPICQNEDEAVGYEELCREYVRIIQEDVGIHVPDCVFFSVPVRPGLVVLYAAQKKLDKSLIGNQILHWAGDEQIFLFFESVLSAMERVCEFNRVNKGRLEVTLDYQLSNWALHSREAKPEIKAGAPLAFIDISTPMFRVNDVEQIDPNYLLRSCPDFLRWILKATVLDEVVSRYYEPRSAVIDIIANCIKEGRESLIPEMLNIANRFFGGRPAGLEIVPLDMKEIYKYYRTDAAIWIAYLEFKIVDRFLKSKLGRKPYDFILPHRMKRNFPLRNKPARD